MIDFVVEKMRKDICQTSSSVCCFLMDRTQVMENKMMFMYHMSVSGRDTVGVFMHCPGYIYIYISIYIYIKPEQRALAHLFGIVK